MTEEVAKVLLAQGVVGALAVIMMYVAWRKDKALEAKNKELAQSHIDHAARVEVIGREHAVRCDALVKEHRTEMQVMVDKYMSKAESWTTRFDELQSAQTTLIESLERKNKRGG